MIQFQNILKPDYDNRITIEKQNVLCYSPKKLRALHPQGNFRIIGEARSFAAAVTAVEETPQKRKKKVIPHIGECAIGNQKLGVAAHGAHSSFLYKKAGYIAVGENQYVCLLTSRLPFLIALFSSVAFFVAGLTLILTLSGGSISGGNDGPILPDHPLPPEDENSLPVEDDESEKVESEEGGGSVSMIYTKEATLLLDQRTLEVYFINPNASNHDVVIYLYLVLDSGEKRLVANSGRIIPGRGIRLFHLDPNAPPLMEGIYDSGLYVVDYYDPETGERAVISSEIEGVRITVKNSN